MSSRSADARRAAGTGTAFVPQLISNGPFPRSFTISLQEAQDRFAAGEHAPVPPFLLQAGIDPALNCREWNVQAMRHQGQFDKGFLDLNHRVGPPGANRLALISARFGVTIQF